MKRIALGLLLLLLVLSGFLHSVWFQSWAGRYAGEVCSRWSGLEVSLQGLQFNLFKRSVAVQGLRVLDRQGQEMVEAEAVYLSLSSYVFKGVDIAALSVLRPRIHIVRRQNEDRSDFKALLQKLGTLKKNKDRRSVTSIRRLRVGEGLFVYDNRSVPVRHDGRIDFKHVEVPVFDADIQNLHIFNKHVCARVRALSAREKSGLEVKSLRTWVGFFPDRLTLKTLDLETAYSHIRGELQFGYCSPKAFADFANAIEITADIAPDSRLSTRDLGYFAKPLQAYRQSVTLSGNVSGRLKDITARHLSVRFGRESRLDADLHWRGFPALRGSDIDLQLAELYVDRQDVLGIEDFASGRLQLPAALAALSQVAVTGDFKGNLERFDTRLTLRTNIGGVDIDVRAQDTLQTQRLKGTVTATALDVGLLAGRSELLGTVDAGLRVSATGTHYDEMHYELDGRIANLQLKGRTLDTIVLNCQTRKNYFHGSVTGTDPALDFCFDGLLDYERAEPISQYVLDVNKVDLQALGLVADGQPFTVSGQVYTDYVGRKLDDILGNLSIRALQVERHGLSFYLPGLQLATQASDSLHKTTQVTSELLHLSLSGRYTISRFPSLYKTMLRAYIPGRNIVGQAFKTVGDSAGPQVFDLELALLDYRHEGRLYDINRLLELFAPALQMDEHTRLNVHYNDLGHVYDLRLDSRYIGFKNILCTDGRVRVRTEAPAHTRMTVSVDASAIYLNDSLSFRNFQTAVSLNGGDSVSWRLVWLNPSDSAGRPKSSGYWATTLDLSDTNALQIRFDSSYFVFAGRPWRIYTDASVLLREGDIRFQDIGLHALENPAYILLSGQWSADTAASLNLAFHEFDMAYLSPLTRQAGMDVAGKINGSLRVRDPKHSFDLVSDITLDDLHLNGGAYGNGWLTAVFNRENRQIDGRLTIGPDTVDKPFLSVAGYVDLKQKTLDFKGDLNRLPVQFLSGYFRSFAADLTGGLDGKLRLSGPLKQMNWTLQAVSDDVAMTVKFLNTRYQFTHLGVNMNEKVIEFTDGRLRDVRYDTRGRLGGLVRHHYLKDFDLDLNLDFDQFLVLNTVPVKDMIYSGRVFATGRVTLSGLTNNLYIGVTARTDEDSHIDFDFSSTGGASNSNFVRFDADRPVEVDPLKAFYARQKQKERGKGRLTVDLGLAINPQLAVGLDIRNATISGTLNAVGSGNIRLLVEPRGTQLFGTYNILNGLFDFSMMDLLNKRFKLKEGGSIVWTGPMTDAQVDIEAVYTTRTSLYPILAASGTTMIDEGNLRKKVGVESIILLDGNLLNPDIRFDINLTNVEEDVKDLFFSYVNKENEDEMIRQTFSLLMFNSFMTMGNEGQGTGMLSGNNALASSSELLFNQFNNFLSRLTTNFNVGMNYTPASEMKESEFQVMLSGQLFDDRLTIDGNIGVSEIEAKNASSVVGDINVEWKFTEQLRLKAFNRSNEKSLAQPDNSYTQGLGVIFRRDFNTAKELFSRIGPTKEERQRQRATRKARRQAEKADQNKK